MATLFDTVVDSDKVWRGAGRVLIAPSGTSFPGRLEEIIQPKTPQPNSHASAYALGTGWVDIGGTNDDGVAVTRGFEGEEGVVVDQLKAPLFAGDPKTWSMQASMTMLHTDYLSLAIGWELPTADTLAADTAGPDYRVAQHYGKFSAPAILTERLLAVVQQHPETEKLRAIVFRKAKKAPEDSEMSVSSGAASGLPVTFDLQADTTIDNDADPFGGVFEED